MIYLSAEVEDSPEAEVWVLDEETFSKFREIAGAGELVLL